MPRLQFSNQYTTLDDRKLICLAIMLLQAWLSSCESFIVHHYFVSMVNVINKRIA